MESQTLTIRAQRQLSTISCHRVFLHHAEVMNIMVVLFCTLFCLAECEPCSVNGMHKPVEYDDACGSYRDNFHLGFQDALEGNVNPEIVSGNSMPQLSIENVCTNSNLFCFPSTLPGLLSEELNSKLTVPEVSRVQSDATLPLGSTQARNNLTWSSNCCIHKLLSGRVVSCSLNLEEGIHDMSFCQTNSGNKNDISSCRGPRLDRIPPSFNPNEHSEKIKSGNLDDSSLTHVEISPRLLEWGEKYLYFPSVAFLTVANTHSDGSLNVYEPYSTNSQFYPCNFSEIMLGPGEVASICFVFLPTWLGLSSAHLILQTSSGGFLIQARGLAVESPYQIQPLVGLDVSSSGRWSKNLSLFNPFDETIYLEEVTAWISFSSGNTSHSTKAICCINNFNGSADLSMPSVKEWLDAKSGQVNPQVMTLRPRSNWEVGPHSTETIIELDFPYHSQGKIFGSFCMQLLRSSEDKIDTVMVPFEAEVGGRLAYDDILTPVSVSLEALVPCGASRTVVALSLRNAAPYLLSVVKISGIGEIKMPFQIKYIEGLIIFPGTVTQVAVVTYNAIATQLQDPPPEISNINMNCKLLILTNDSRSPEIEIPCNDIVSICSRHQSGSYVGFEHHSEKVEPGNARTWPLHGGMQSPSQVKALEMAAADELVLANWRSQSTRSGMSVLDEHEIIFHMVEVGTHLSKWITVKNPSHQPVIMQLILNSAQVIDECRDLDGLLQPSSSSSLARDKYTTPIRYGFSIAESALTEAYVHPYGRASFGPILFHPSSLCEWKSSALIRNNLSGVESLSLRGFGGSLSLVLFEGSEPLQTIEFKFNMPSLNPSPPDRLHNVEDNCRACSQPLSKELYAKNMGDLPLEVRRVEISGTECRLDGFVVHNCNGFTLEPGESTKLIISYRTDFSAAMVQRDLELALATGILVIPMKASLPMPMINFCKKSILWKRLKQSSVAILLVVSTMFLVFCCILPQVMVFVSQDYLFECGKSPIAILRRAGKSSREHRNQKTSIKFAMPTKMNGFLRSIGEEETLMLESIGRHHDGIDAATELGRTADHVSPQTNCLSDNGKKMVVESSHIEESSQPGNLTVKTGKEKGRRRRKRKGSGTGLQLEVSSSQSSNSTPSSPLSPAASFTPKRSWPLSPDVDQCTDARNSFTPVADRRSEKSSSNESASKESVLEPKVSVKYGCNSLFFPTQENPSNAPRRMTSKPLLLPSATFPSTGRPAPNMTCSPFLPSTPTIAPHARAPGSKLYDRETVKTEKKTGHEDEFKYDIWGDHLFGLHRIGRGKEVYAMSPLAKQSNSDSFFVRGPQTLVTNSKLKSVSSHHLG